MKWIDKQGRLEKRVENCIDILAEEFELEVPYYPESYYVTRNSCFEDYALPEKFREQFEDMKIRKSGECWSSPLIVWATNWDIDVTEESSHAFNFLLSGAKKYSNLGDVFFVDVLSEVCGFLGSKILDFERKNPFLIKQDIYQMEGEKIVDFLNQYYEIGVHQQGYLLGEIMFYEYAKGNLKKVEIRDLFQTNFDETGLAMETFDGLRKRFWPHPN